MSGVGNFIWRISVALYLLATGVLGTFYQSGHLEDIFGKGNNVFIIIAGVIAFAAGILLLLEMLNVKVSILDTLIFIVAIIWAVFTVFVLIQWIGNSFKNLWEVLQQLGVYVMVCASLLIASKRFG